MWIAWRTFFTEPAICVNQQRRTTELDAIVLELAGVESRELGFSKRFCFRDNFSYTVCIYSNMKKLGANNVSTVTT